ncbi:MAG: dihydrolipoyl dehydrogenase [Armatimonadetes bacterium]|nr:dihydrolipoyl dehydrogenase [Armatimonadota bacterium]
MALRQPDLHATSRNCSRNPVTCWICGDIPKLGVSKEELLGDVLQSELLIIGGGPGGYAAAFRAADLGLDVTLVEDHDHLGGVCLHRGCIPSKALLHLARLLFEAREAEEFGVTFGAPNIDLAKVRRWKSDSIQRIAAGLAELARLRKVRRITGRAVFRDSQHAIVDGADVSEITFKQAIVATGSRPVNLPGLDPGDPWVMDSTEALKLEDLPERLLVVGGGYIGFELGTVYAALGSKVTVVEATDTLLPGGDRDLVRPVEGRAKRLFENAFVSTKVVSAEMHGGEVRVTLAGDLEKPVQCFDRILVAVGRRPNTDFLGLETTKVELDSKGFIRVNERRQSSDSSIYAVGDVAGQPMLAHKASREGKVAVEVIAGLPAAFDNRTIPAVIFTDPEIAWCGLTETEAAAQGREVKVVRFPWSASGRAVAQGASEGLTKFLLDPKDERILGMGIVGVGAGELIDGGVLAMEMGAVAEDVAATIHPHPTFSETIMETAEVALDSSTHRYQPRKPPAEN